MSINPTGPVSAEELRRIADLPYGKAVDELRKHDPFWGRAEGEKIKWRVRYTERVTMRGSVTVEAASEEEAVKIADKLTDEGKINFDDDSLNFGGGDIEFYDVKPL